VFPRRAPAASATSSCAFWAKRCATRLGQPLIIENRPGGAGNIAARACQDATPDGYTICIINADPLIYNQFLFRRSPSILSMAEPHHQSVSSDPGAGDQFGSRRQERRRTHRRVEGKAGHAELSHRLGAARRLYDSLKRDKGADWVRVPFKGGGEATNAILGGSTPIGLIGLATSPRRSPPAR